jgi:RND family efflux transporter MFP subunit
MPDDTNTTMDNIKASAYVPHSDAHGDVARQARLFIGAILLGGLLASGCSKPEAPEEAPTVNVQVDAAAVGPIQRKVEADATLFPLDQAAIAPKITAPVVKFYVERGSRVRAGQLLAELENKDLVGAATESEGSYQQADAGYQQALQKAEQDLRLSKQQMDSAQRLLDNRQNLFKEGAASARDVDDASVALTQAKNQYELAQQRLDLKAAEGGLTAAKGKNAGAAALLSYTRIVSPIDGVVTDRPIYEGETAPSGSPIITVMNLSQVIARAHISQQEAALIKVGDAGTVTVAPVPAARGKVTLVSPALDPNSTTVEVWVQVPNPQGLLKPGASAHVAVVTQTVPNAIVAPTTALLTGSDGGTSVMVLDTDNKVSRKRVKVGIRDGANMQVLEGLKKGDRVVTVGAFVLDRMDEDDLPKTKIQVQAPPGVELEEEENP